MQPGDSYLINDPYRGGAFHLPGHRGHHAGLSRRASHRVHREHLAQARRRWPGPRLVERPGAGDAARGAAASGRPRLDEEGLNVDVDAVMRANSRTPEELMGDIRAQIGCTRVGSARLLQLAEEYGLDVLRRASARCRIAPSACSERNSRRSRTGRQKPSGSSTATAPISTPRSAFTCAEASPAST